MGNYLSLIITDKCDEKSLLETTRVDERIRLRLDQDYEFFDLFEQVTSTKKLPVARSRPFPKYLYLVIVDDDRGLTSITKDKMGNPLSYFLAGDFKCKRWPKDMRNALNHAAFAYIKALPSDFPIVLYWY